MLLLLFQIILTPFVSTILLMALPILMIVTGVIMLKIGLKIVEGETRNSVKWILISLGIQIGVIVFIISPLLLLGLGLGFGILNPGLFAPIVIFAIIIDFNVVNVIHKLGMRKTVIVFLLTIIPIVIFGGIFALVAVILFF